MAALNQYFDRMVQVIFAHHGALDKYLGDGLMALFGAPLEQPDHPRHAVQAAIADLNAVRRRANLAPLNVGIGINRGEAIVGSIGTEERMAYTVIGDTVNVAQRLQTEAAASPSAPTASVRPALPDVRAAGSKLLIARSDEKPYSISPCPVCRSGGIGRRA